MSSSFVCKFVTINKDIAINRNLGKNLSKTFSINSLYIKNVSADPIRKKYEENSLISVILPTEKLYISKAIYESAISISRAIKTIIKTLPNLKAFSLANFLRKAFE